MISVSSFRPTTVLGEGGHPEALQRLDSFVPAGGMPSVPAPVVHPHVTVRREYRKEGVAGLTA